MTPEAARALRETLVSEVSRALTAWRRSPTPARAQAVYVASRRAYSYSKEVSKVLAEPALRWPWPRRVLSEVEEGLPRGVRIVRTVVKTEWRPALDALRRLRGT